MHALAAFLPVGVEATDSGAIMLTATTFAVVVTCGSGKPDAPCARMQRAYA